MKKPLPILPVVAILFVCFLSSSNAAASATSLPAASPPPRGALLHFMLWNEDTYDFRGGCDLVLVQNQDFADGLGLNIHIRTVVKGDWNFLQAAAIEIGPDTLEIQGGGKFYTNQQLNVIPASLSLRFPVTYKKISSKHQRFHIDLGEGSFVCMEIYNDFVSVNVRAQEISEQFRNGRTGGLMGSFPDGIKLARDGKTVLVDDNDFGMEWQVRPNSDDPRLFHSYGQGGVVEYPTQCALPNKQAKVSAHRRRLGVSSHPKRSCAPAAPSLMCWSPLTVKSTWLNLVSQAFTNFEEWVGSSKSVFAKLLSSLRIVDV